MHSETAPRPPVLASTPWRRAAAATTGLLLATHPAPTVAVTAVAAALAGAAGRGTAGVVLVALAVLTGQLSVGWSNDRIDIARDRVTDRRDKPLVTGAIGARTVAVAAGCAVVVCVPLSLAAGGVVGGPAHLLAVAAAWAYNLGAKRTLLSWLPYAVGFGLLPAFITLGLPGHPWPPAWLMGAAALLGTGAHITNVLPDIDTDLAAGTRGLPQRLGQARARTLAAVLLLGASLVLVLGPSDPPGAIGWTGLAVTSVLAVLIVLPLGSRPDSRLPFLATLALAGTDVALLLLRGSTLA